MEKVTVGFSAPGSIDVEVEDPSDEEAVIEAFVEKVDELREKGELMEHIERDGGWLSENIHYVDGEDGEVIHQW